MLLSNQQVDLRHPCMQPLGPVTCTLRWTSCIVSVWRRPPRWPCRKPYTSTAGDKGSPPPPSTTTTTTTHPPLPPLTPVPLTTTYPSLPTPLHRFPHSSFTDNLVLSQLPSQEPGVKESVLGLVSPVTGQNIKFDLATSISVLQHVQLSK